MQAIDQTLRAQKWPTGKTLATDLEVDPRTIRRDLEFMRDEHHAPIAFDRVRRGYYYADPTFRLPLPGWQPGDEVVEFVPSTSASVFCLRPPLPAWGFWSFHDPAITAVELNVKPQTRNKG
jgi:hypothetical protein